MIESFILKKWLLTIKTKNIKNKSTMNQNYFLNKTKRIIGLKK